MITCEINGFYYYVCEKCKEVFFGEDICFRHERLCKGVYIPEAFTVHVSLCDTRNTGLKTAISKEQGVPPTPRDKITVNMATPFLASSHGATKIESSPVSVDDLQYAASLVKAKLIECLVNLAKNVWDIDQFVDMITHNIQQAREDAQTYHR